MRYALIQVSLVLSIQYVINSYLSDYFQSILYTYLVFIVLECMKFFKKKLSKMIGVDKLLLNKDFKDIILELTEVFDKIVIFFKIFIVMGCGTSSLYIFYYKKSYLGVHHYVPLGIFVVLGLFIGLVSYFQFLTAHELANKKPEDYGYLGVSHHVNASLEEHYETDAWVINYYQSFVYVLMFLSILSTICEVGALVSDITLPSFLSEYLNFFKRKELVWFLYSNMYALFWVKLLVKVCMNPIRKLARKVFIKYAATSLAVTGVTTVATATGVAYVDVADTVSGVRGGDVSALGKYPDWFVQLIQQSQDLTPFRDEHGKALAHFMRQSGENFDHLMVFDKKGFLLTGPTINNFLDYGYVCDKGIMRPETTMEWGYRTCWGTLGHPGTLKNK